MITSYEQIREFLPRYLNPNSQQELFEELKRFPNNIDGRFYTSARKREDTIFQGDGISDMLVVNLPDPTIKGAPSIIVSNTCDIAVENSRLFRSSICYSPIFNLEKYKRMLESIWGEKKIQEHIETVKKQRITQIFYLPQGQGLENESLVFLDRINSCQNGAIPRDGISRKKLFTLSNYGYWLFMVKLSIHFTRFMDGVDRFVGDFGEQKR